MSIKTASNRTSLDRAKLEGAIVQAIKDWAVAYPHELVALTKTVKGFRDGLYHRKGISQRGDMLHKAEIPTTLYGMLQARVDPHWTRDRWVLNTFLKHFRVGLVNTTSEIKP